MKGRVAGVSVVLCVIFSSVAGQKDQNNVCPTFEDYNTMRNNSNCWYDFAAELNAPEIIQRMGYPILEYKVTVPDGHILTMFRIPNHKTSDEYTKYHPVYLQHGLVATCATFLGLGKDSLAFVLADAGYDVWLGNYRGNAYSEEHDNLTVYDQDFWDHSLDEVVAYDLRTSFHTIMAHSPPGSKITFIGHSLGTSIGLMYGAEYPEESSQIVKMCILLCPAYTLTNMISPYRFLAPFGDLIVDVVRRLKLFRTYSQASELRRLIVPMCTESPEMMQLCMQLYNLFYGRETDLGPEKVPVYFNQLPGGTSIRILNHAAQFVLGQFRHYNFKFQNFQKYGTLFPPEYDLKKLLVPVYLVVSKADWATPEADARNLWKHLPGRAKHGLRIIDRSFNHIDFVFGRHARQVVYDPLVRVLNKAIRN